MSDTANTEQKIHIAPHPANFPNPATHSGCDGTDVYRRVAKNISRRSSADRINGEKGMYPTCSITRRHNQRVIFGSFSCHARLFPRNYFNVLLPASAGLCDSDVSMSVCLSGRLSHAGRIVPSTAKAGS